ncbi:MAG: GldG family protein [Acidobacteria bacterium]|nr:GldG family protein [Acidobacteriota bacterium]
MKRYLAIPGALLLIAAFIRATVNIEWDMTSFWLVAAGAVVVGVTVVWNWQQVVDWFRDPRGVFAVMTGISTAALVAVLVMLNILVWYNPWSVDLTASGRNQVTEETRQILARLEQPVSLRQFGRASADPRIEQLLRSFERESRRVRVEFADADREREQATRYGIIKLGTVVVISDDKFRKVEDPNEQALVTAILQVTSDEERVVCFATGHGERGVNDTGSNGLATLKATLEAANYRTQPFTLLEGDVPTECAAVVVAGPREPYSAQELARLTAYADTFGRLALLLEPDPAPGFGEWLKPRGIEPLAGGIVDASGAGRQVGGGPRTPLAVGYGDHPVTRGFNIASMYEGARPLQVIERPELGGRPTALAFTSDRSFATSATDAELAFDAQRDRRGPLTLAAATAVRGRRPEDEVRIAVFGDSDFVSNAFLRRQGNRDLFLRTLAWLLGEQEATIVAVSPRENRRLELTERTRVWMYLVNLGLLPLLPLAAGVIVFLRSRR